MENHVGLLCVLFLLAACAAAGRGDELRVLPDKLDGQPPSQMMRRYLLAQTQDAWRRWQEEYEKRTTPEQIAANQKRLRDRFLQAIGGLPKRTPLNPRVTGVIRREGYRVEKVIFESQPKHYVAAALFLPDAAAHKPPYPGVIVPCGHAENAKAHGEYQSMGALLALNGMAGLVFDPIDQGERCQLLHAKRKTGLWGTKAHTLIGVGSILLGRSTARFEIWDGMRAIDYLQSRPEVDPKRIGCTGNSGGGTQTSYLMSLDDRIQAAAPSCYLNKLVRQLDNACGDAEQEIFAQLEFGMEHADYMTMRAPMPLLICAATKDFFDIRATWESFRYAKRLYTRLGFSQRVDLLENDAGHNYNTQQRQGVVRWMARWLLHKDEPITEPAIQQLTEKELNCTPEGEVMLLEGARSTYDLNGEYERKLAPARRRAWSDAANRPKLLAEVRRIAGIRKLADLPQPEVRQVGSLKRDGYRMDKLVIVPEEGVYLPALRFVPAGKKSERVVLCVSEWGKSADAKPGGPIEKLVQSGSVVWAVDLRGTGETQQTAQGGWRPEIGPDWEDYFAAYALGRSYVGMRAEDVLVCARLAAGVGSGPATRTATRPASATAPAARTVQLIAIGGVGVPALHAAALEPDLFESVKLRETLFAWADVVDSRPSRGQLMNTVHGALLTYDLLDLAGTLGKKLTLEVRMDGKNQPVVKIR